MLNLTAGQIESLLTSNGYALSRARTKQQRDETHAIQVQLQAEWRRLMELTAGADVVTVTDTTGDVCGQRWVAEIAKCPRCGLDAAAHAHIPSAE